MSLATRCTACGTIFRVVQDQLRVSEGWVRCGRCAEVFDAREQLFDLDREAPPPWPPAGPESMSDAASEEAFAPAQPPAPAPRVAPPAQPAAHAAPPLARPPTPTPTPAPPPARPMAREAAAMAPAALPSAGVSTVAHEEARQPLQAPAWSAGGEHPGDRREPFWEEPSTPAAPLDAREDLPEPKGLKFEPPEPLEETPAPLAARSPAAPQPAAAASPDLGPDVVLSPRLQTAQAQAKAAQESAPAPASAASTPPDAPARKPGFLRRAEGEARWQRPGVRLALGLGSVLLLLTAAAQLGWHYRDALSTQSPLARQWLGGACERLGCELQPWRRLDAFSVESTGLSEAASGNHYKFSLSLRNKSPWELATPWVELSLNDGNGKVLMKKALKPEDFVNGRASTGANSEQALQLVFSTGRQRVNGYTVEIFYP